MNVSTQTGGIDRSRSFPSNQIYGILMCVVVSMCVCVSIKPPSFQGLLPRHWCSDHTIDNISIMFCPYQSDGRQKGKCHANMLLTIAIIVVSFVTNTIKMVYVDVDVDVDDVVSI